MVKQVMMKRLMAMVMCGALCGVMSTAACSGTDTPVTPQKLRIDVFGWGPGDDTTTNEFVDGMPLYEGARTVRVIGSIPSQNKIVAQEIGTIEGKSVKLPELPYADELRLDLEVRDASDNVLATGATSTFSIDDGASPRGLRMMVAPIDQFVPSGSVVQNSEGERLFVISTLDYRSERLRLRDAGSSSAPWLGRAGHATAMTSDGKVLVVGGTPNVPPDGIGGNISMSAAYADVQLYDPETGYFTDLNLNEDESAPQPEGRDRLNEPRAFHTLTSLGDDKFIVAGGYTVRTLPDSKQTRPVRDLELIDLKAEYGKRVTVITDSAGVNLQLGLPRAFHKSIYLEEDGKLLLIGGRGQEPGTTTTDDAVVSSIEIVDIFAQKVVPQRFEAEIARTDHAVALLGDGSILVAGGRNEEGALTSTQIITLGATGLDIKAGPELNQARYGFGLEVVVGGTGRNVLVMGGYTAEDAVTGSVELGIVSTSGSFSPLAGQTLSAARGGLTTMTLPQSGDIMIFGGRDAAGATVATAERLRFNGVLSTPIYERLDQSFGSFVIPRYSATYTFMSNGKILVFGGIDQSVPGEVVAIDKAEFYNPYDPVGEVR